MSFYIFILDCNEPKLGSSTKNCKNNRRADVWHISNKIYYLHWHLTANGSTIFESQKAEKILRPEDIRPGDKVVPPFNAYSAPGDFTTQKLFYVNYGREEDFYWLKNNKSVNFNDSVVIARYGKIFRGDKVFL